MNIVKEYFESINENEKKECLLRNNKTDLSPTRSSC